MNPDRAIREGVYVIVNTSQGESEWPVLGYDDAKVYMVLATAVDLRDTLAAENNNPYLQVYRLAPVEPEEIARLQPKVGDQVYALEPDDPNGRIEAIDQSEALSVYQVRLSDGRLVNLRRHQFEY